MNWATKDQFWHVVSSQLDHKLLHSSRLLGLQLYCLRRFLPTEGLSQAWSSSCCSWLLIMCPLVTPSWGPGSLTLSLPWWQPIQQCLGGLLLLILAKGNIWSDGAGKSGSMTRRQRSSLSPWPWRDSRSKPSHLQKCLQEPRHPLLWHCTPPGLSHCPGKHEWTLLQDPCF